MFLDEGFDEVEIKYAVGRWEWIEFPFVESSNSFKQNVGTTKYFSELIPLAKNFMIKERAVWIEIHRLPLYAWSLAAYKKVATLYGTVLFVDDLDDRLSSGRICICTSVVEYISDNPLVSIKGRDYNVIVREFSFW